MKIALAWDRHGDQDENLGFSPDLSPRPGEVPAEREGTPECAIEGADEECQFWSWGSCFGMYFIPLTSLSHIPCGKRQESWWHWTKMGWTLPVKLMDPSTPWMRCSGAVLHSPDAPGLSMRVPSAAERIGCWLFSTESLSVIFPWQRELVYRRLPLFKQEQKWSDSLTLIQENLDSHLRIRGPHGSLL